MLTRHHLEEERSVQLQVAVGVLFKGSRFVFRKKTSTPSKTKGFDDLRQKFDDQLLHPPPFSMQKRLRGHYRVIEIVPLVAESHSDTF